MSRNLNIIKQETSLFNLSRLLLGWLEIKIIQIKLDIMTQYKHMRYFLYILWIVFCIIFQKFGWKVGKSFGFAETSRIDWIGHFLSSLCFQYCLHWDIYIYIYIYHFIYNIYKERVRERERVCVYEEDKGRERERRGHFLSLVSILLHWERERKRERECVCVFPCVRERKGRKGYFPSPLWFQYCLHLEGVREKERNCMCVFM